MASSSDFHSAPLFPAHNIKIDEFQSEGSKTRMVATVKWNNEEYTVTYKNDKVMTEAEAKTALESKIEKLYILKTRYMDGTVSKFKWNTQTDTLKRTFSDPSKHKDAPARETTIKWQFYDPAYRAAKEAKYRQNNIDPASYDKFLSRLKRMETAQKLLEEHTHRHPQPAGSRDHSSQELELEMRHGQAAHGLSHARPHASSASGGSSRLLIEEDDDQPLKPPGRQPPSVVELDAPDREPIESEKAKQAQRKEAQDVINQSFLSSADDLFGDDE